MATTVHSTSTPHMLTEYYVFFRSRYDLTAIHSSKYDVLPEALYSLFLFFFSLTPSGPSWPVWPLDHAPFGQSGVQALA